MNVNCYVFKIRKDIFAQITEKICSSFFLPPPPPSLCPSLLSQPFKVLK